MPAMETHPLTLPLHLIKVVHNLKSSLATERYLYDKIYDLSLLHFHPDEKFGNDYVTFTSNFTAPSTKHPNSQHEKASQKSHAWQKNCR